ncbi:hypothetical protein SDC9_148361 [bioreactor metagenome]|uniref:Uncharacterized protein n=1 Tax=bioreactor metagenome TaxID=1076179 RepID=A0A645EGM2_9ZZZZ
MLGKNIDTNIAYIGNLAPHVIRGAISAVIFLSCSFSNVLVAIIAGEEHPTPKIIGMNAFPDNPTLLITLSIKNAILAIYPLSSNKVIPKNKVNINGKNGKVPPILPITPSTINEWNHSLEFANILLIGL